MENEYGFTIIIPAYNEATSIINVIEEVNKLTGHYEVIVVDDSSTDGTFVGVFIKASFVPSVELLSTLMMTAFLCGKCSVNPLLATSVGNEIQSTSL